MNLSDFIPPVASLVIAVLVYLAIKDINIISFGKSAADRLGDFADADRRALTDKMGDALIARLGLDLRDWAYQLRWAQLGGHYQNSTVGTIAGQAVLYVLLAFAGALIIGFSLLTSGIVLVAAWLPYLQLRDKAERVREAVRRALPEAAAFVAGEMAAGVSADQSLVRVSVLSGPLAALIAQFADKSRSSGRVLLSQAGVRGVFRELAEEMNLQELISFAAQLDMVSERGAEGPRLMSDVAKMLARSYRIEINRAAAGLSMKVLVPMSAFFLVPMLASMLVPLFISILNVFLG